MVRPIGQQQPGRNINYSPVKRDMSHLASIASMLSPSKPESQIKGNEGDKETEKHSRPASPQLRSQSKVPVPQATSNSNSPARPRSPAYTNIISTSKDASASGQTASPHNRPVSPSRISSRIAALAGAARGTTPSSRDASPKTAKGSLPPSPRFGLTRSPRLKQALGMESPSQRPASPSMVSNTAPTASGIPTPTKVKRPMISPIQSPNSQRSLALSSLRKAVPGFETNAFTSPPVSPRLPSTSSVLSTSNIHQTVAAPAQESKNKGVMSKEDVEMEEIRSQLAKDEALIDQHARAISSLGKSLPSASSPQIAKPEVKAVAKPIGLSPPAKSPLRKINSQLALAAKAAGASPGTAAAIAEEKTAPTPSKDSDDTVMPQTVVKKLETDTVHSTAHKDSTVELPPPSPLFSTFLSQNKRTSTLSFAGLPGRTLGGAGGREKSLGLGMGLGKSLGATAAKERVAQGEDQESQGSNTATASSGHTRQSFYTAALASQSRKRLSSTLGSVHPPLKADTESQGSKALRTEFSQTARSSLLASQMQQQSLSQSAQPMSHSARFDLLRSRISNIKGTTGYLAPSTSMRTSFAPSTQPASSAQSVLPSTAKKSEAKPAEKVQSSALEKTISTHSLFSPHSQVNQKETTTLSTSATSTFAATIASFVPAPAFGTSFASLFGAGSMRVTKPDSPAKTGNEASKPVQGSLYPSLPSMTNLHMPLPSFSPPSKMHKPALPSDTDEDLVEELASPLAGEDVVDRARAIAPSSPELPRTKRASSVQSIVSAIEAKEAEAKREKDRQSSLSPRKASGASALQVTLAVESAQTKTVAPRSTRSTTPTFSPPRQQLLPRLSNERQDARHLSSRPESRLSDMPAVPVLDAGSANLSIAGMVDIEDPGLDAIPRASFSDDTEIPTTDAVSETEDEEMDQADDEGDEYATGTRGPTFVNEVKATAVSTLQQSAPPVQQYKPATTSSANLSKSTFKPTRPGKEAGETQV